MRTVKTNGFFVDLEDPPSIYRQDPSPEVDAAWERISRFEYQMISSNDVRLLGKDPRTTVKAPESWGYGPDAHIARTEVSHQMHCLNVLRKAMYPDYYPKERNGDPATLPLWRPHATHCLHILLQHLTCTASVDVVTYNWREMQTHPSPDFSINRQCRGFDAILEWQDGNKVPDIEEKRRQWLKNLPDGATEIRRFVQCHVDAMMTDQEKNARGENHVDGAREICRNTRESLDASPCTLRPDKTFRRIVPDH